MAVRRASKVQWRFQAKLLITATQKAAIAAGMWCTSSAPLRSREHGEVDDVAGGADEAEAQQLHPVRGLAGAVVDPPDQPRRRGGRSHGRAPTSQPPPPRAAARRGSGAPGPRSGRATSPATSRDRPLIASRLDAGLEPAEQQRAERVARLERAVAAARAVAHPAPVDELVAGLGGDQDLAGMRRAERRPQPRERVRDRSGESKTSPSTSRRRAPRGRPSASSATPRRSRVRDAGAKAQGRRRRARRRRRIRGRRAVGVTAQERRRRRARARRRGRRRRARRRRSRTPACRRSPRRPSDSTYTAPARELGQTASSATVGSLSFGCSTRQSAPSSLGQRQRPGDLGLGVVGDQDHRVIGRGSDRARRRRRRARRTPHRRERPTPTARPGPNLCEW